MVASESDWILHTFGIHHLADETDDLRGLLRLKPAYVGRLAVWRFKKHRMPAETTSLRLAPLNG